MVEHTRRTVCALGGGLAMAAMGGGVQAEDAAPVAMTRRLSSTGPPVRRSVYRREPGGTMPVRWASTASPSTTA